MRNLPMIIALLALPIGAARAQESDIHADFRGEATRFKQSCEEFTVKKIPGCTDLLFTDHPLHIAVGSIAPQNGFGAGVAYVGHYTPNELWRTSWDADAIALDNASWRAGFYYKAIHTPIEKIKVITTTSRPAPKSNLAVHPYTVFNLSAQSISLDQLFFYGLGPNSRQANASVFSMRQTIAGANAIVPVLHSLNASLLGEINGRFVDLQGNHHESSPSIEQIFTEATAPGLATPPAFAQLGEGVRLEPRDLQRSSANRLPGAVSAVLAPSDAHYSFRRFTVDLDHTIPLYRNCGSWPPNQPTARTSALLHWELRSVPPSSAIAKAHLNCGWSSPSPSLPRVALSPSTSSQPLADQTSTVIHGSPVTTTIDFARLTPFCCEKVLSTPSGDLSALPSPPIRANSHSHAGILPSIILPTASPRDLRCAQEVSRLSRSPLPGVAPKARTPLPTSTHPCLEDRLDLPSFDLRSQSSSVACESRNFTVQSRQFADFFDTLSSHDSALENIPVNRIRPEKRPTVLQTVNPRVINLEAGPKPRILD